MCRFIFPILCLFVLAFLSYSECAPPQMLSPSEFERRRDESVRKLIEKEHLTCENLKEFCYRGKHEDVDEVTDAMAKLYCQIVLEGYLCINN